MVYRKVAKIFALFLFVWWGGMVKTAVSQSLPLPLADYWQHITELSNLVTSLRDAPIETQQTQLAAAAETLQNITAVSLPTGQTVPLDHTILLAKLKATPPDLDNLYLLLKAMLTAQEKWPIRQFGRSQLQDLQEILARPEFNYAPPEPTPWQQWWDEFWQRIREFFSSLLPEVSGETSLLLGDIFSVVGAIILGVVLFYAFRGLLADFTAQANLVAQEEMGESLTADLALQRAQEFSIGGDYRTAVRYLYLSSLLILEERGLLRYHRYLTNREYLRTIAHKPELAAVLRDVIEVFDRVWYGFEPLGEAEYSRYASRVAELKQQR